MMSSSNYARRMAKLSAKIFGELSRETDMKSTKVLRIFSGKPPHMDPYYNVDYYPRHVELKQLMDGLREHGLFR
jgi:small subunit ribosomal protein S33